METNMLLLLNKKRAEVKWMISLRKATYEQKRIMLAAKCPKCASEIIRLSYMLSEEDLNNEVTMFDDHILEILTEVDINQAL